MPPCTQHGAEQNLSAASFCHNASTCLLCCFWSPRRSKLAHDQQTMCAPVTSTSQLDCCIHNLHNDKNNILQVLPANARYLLGVSYPSSERQHILIVDTKLHHMTVAPYALRMIMILAIHHVLTFKFMLSSYSPCLCSSAIVSLLCCRSALHICI